MAYHPTISHLRFPRYPSSWQPRQQCDNLGIPDECQSVLAPVGCLPSEILTQIFKLSMTHVFGTLEFEEDHYNKPTYRIEITRLGHTPLLLASHVCARWHTIVMGTPSLWTVLRLGPTLWKTAQRPSTVSRNYC
ncbi:hypothetical protein B0H14DRAFT_2932721, partial [Mycena olivaceomarginata]